jgi:hypothetical protein
VSWRAAFVVVAIEDVRLPSVPFVRSPVRIASGSAGVPGGGDGVRPDTTGQAGVRKAVRSWRPLWTPDTTAWTLDADQACGRSGIEHGCRWSRRVGPGAGSCWGWPKASMCIVVLSGQGQDGRAAWLAVAGWPGAWSDAGRWRCPPLGRRCPDRVHTHRLGGHLDWDVRTVERSATSVARPATAGCPQEDWSAETVSRRVSGDCTLAEAGGQPDCGHVRHATGEVLEVPTGRSRVGARADERLRRGDLLPPPIGPTDECGGGVGQWVSVSGSVCRR